ncbi:DUF6438 domain-containing protein [Deinococcus altitudinis]|uniref:DUF6438 domain-containing protein n=1 Tax=Deinococcus altitudinis TaxID=468914 RepID=UPI003891AE0D
MKGVKRFLIAAVTLFMAPAQAGGTDPSPTAFELSLNREACFGSCPAYTVRVNGNGAVEWMGRKWVRHPGASSTTVEPATVKQLQQEVKAANFFTLSDDYTRMNVSDLSYVTLEVRQGPRRKTVRFYLGDPNVPPVLVNLAKQVDLDLGTASWIRDR